MKVVLMTAAFAALLSSTAAAAPVYNITAGTLSYTNSYLGSGLGNTFSFTGPEPVSVSGGGATAVAYSSLQSLGVSFGLTLGLVIDDTGNESGGASANGTNYGDSQYLAAITTELISTPITLTAGHLTVSVPATVVGQLNVCTPDATCVVSTGSNPFDASFGTLSGTLTVSFEQFNFGSTYDLTSAVFTTSAATPEPAAWLFSFGGLALVVLKGSRTRKK